MSLNIQLKEEFLTREISFGGKGGALGSRTTADLAKFLLLAYLSSRTDYVAMFNNPPTKQQLLDDGVTFDDLSTPAPTPPVTALTGTVWNISKYAKQTVSMPPQIQSRTIYVVSDSGNDGALFVSAHGQNLTLVEGDFSKTLVTNSTKDTLIRYTNFSGVREAWIDNPEGMAIPDSLEIGDTLTVGGGLQMGNNAQINLNGPSGSLRLQGGGSIYFEGAGEGTTPGNINMDGGSLNLGQNGKVDFGGGVDLTVDGNNGAFILRRVILLDDSDGSKYLLRSIDGELNLSRVEE